MSTPMLEGGRVVVSDDAAATVMASGSVADGRIDEDDDPAAAVMSAEDAASSMLALEKESAIKTKPRILVFRRSTRYYNSVWAIG